MGETIARLHAILRKCEKKLTLWDNSLLDEMEGWVRQTLRQNGWKTGSGKPLPRSAAGLSPMSQLPEGHRAGSGHIQGVHAV